VEKLFEVPDMYVVRDVFADQFSKEFPPLAVEPDVQSEATLILAASPQ